MRKHAECHSVLPVLAAALLLLIAPILASDPAWTRLESGETAYINDVFFLTENLGWVSVASGILLKTTDGGASWVPESASSSGFNSVRFLNPEVGWAGGLNNVRRTLDGGATWGGVNYVGTGGINRNRTFPVSENVAWAVGGTATVGFVSHVRYVFTGPGSVETNFWNLPGQVLTDVVFLDPDNGWSVGAQGRIYRITNGSAASPTITPLNSGVGNWLTGICMLSQNLGWVVGTSGLILKTENGGLTWNPQTSGTSETLEDIFFSDENQGFAVGAKGTILVTTDGGTNWTGESSGVAGDLQAVTFVNGVGFAVGQGGTILKRASAQDEYRLYFAQFGDGAVQGLYISSQLTLLNPDPAAPASGTVRLRNGDGTPMSVDLNGSTISGEASFTIPARGMIRLRTDGTGSLVVGPVEVTADRPIAGVVVFDSSFGFAGVGNSRAVRKFSSPVEKGAGFNTGVAVMNLGVAQTLQVELLDEQGELVALGRLDLGALGQRSLYVNESGFNWDRLVDFTEFAGSMVITGSGELAATVILDRSGKLATLPVVEWTEGQ